MKEAGLVDTGELAGSLIVLIIWLIFLVVYIAAVWIIFQKSGRPGWMAIIPLLNTYCCSRSSDSPGGSFC